MSNAPLIHPLQELGARRFSFYPPVRNVEHNEWQFRRATWSEVVVVNTHTREEALLPRASVGEISVVDHPVVIVGLRRELEWRDGAVYPHRRPVIEFPQAIAVNGGEAVPAEPAVRSHRLAPVVSIRLEPRPAARTGVKVAVAVMLGAVACLLAADIVREVQVRQRSTKLSAEDDAASIVRKLGPAARETTIGEYQILVWPVRRVSVVLKNRHYIGAIDSGGRVLDAVALPDGHSPGTTAPGTTAALLRSLPRF